MNNLIRVVVAIIRNNEGKILITQRQADRVQPNLWEFPGGKISLYETGLQALKREVFEEVDIQIEKAMPFMQIYHDYKDYSVWLDIWQVENYTGIASGKEGQNIDWVYLNQLTKYDFLDANKHIFKALKLPNFYFKMENYYKLDDYLAHIKALKDTNIKLIELSASNLSPKDYTKLIDAVLPLAKSQNMQIILTDKLENLTKFPYADGISLAAKDLHKFKQRTIAKDKLLCVWCKDAQDLELAEKLEADLVILTPLLNQATYSWNKFQQLTASTNLPVYFAGGLDESMFARVRALGGLGAVLES